MGMGVSGGQGPERFRAMGEINVTPLDIMLVLLIIFMVAAPLMTQGVEVALPETAANSMASNEEPLIISVTANGQASIESRVVSLEEMEVKVRAIRQNNPKLPIYIRGDRSADYGAVVVVMARLQQAGITQVGLVTEAP
jgi:biopolymer transport protein TolR